MMIDQEIIDFISDNHVATICCTENNTPWCFNCLYSILDTDGYLVFKSSLNTRHGILLENNNKIAGSILPDLFDASAIQGIQFEGVVIEDGESAISGAATAYYSKYPMAMPMPGKLWIIELKTLKFTDNTQGFGYKNSWKKQQHSLKAVS